MVGRKSSTPTTSKTTYSREDKSVKFGAVAVGDGVAVRGTRGSAPTATSPIAATAITIEVPSTDLQAVATHWHELPPRERKILSMRFYDGMSQDQIGQRLGISQMQVSRLLAHALGYLRPRLLGLTETG